MIKKPLVVIMLYKKISVRWTKQNSKNNITITQYYIELESLRRGFQLFPASSLSTEGKTSSW